MINNRYLRLIFGLVLYALGIVLTINGNLGLGPWDAFHVGLSKTIGVSFGQISIMVGLLVLIINYNLDESIGIGTIANIFVIGLLIDFIFYLKIIPISHSLLSGAFMLFFGMVFIAFASYCYIGSGFGTGPRDGLMVALTRVTKKPIGLIRGIIEMSVLLMGYLLGAKIGLGTVFLAFGIGPIVQSTFKILNFDVNSVNHNSLIKKSNGKNKTLLNKNKLNL
jgi:uncharacterized membrane protein YczE